MAYHLKTDSPRDRELVVEVLRAGASQRTRAATAASGELFGANGPRDKRPASFRVARVLAEAADLTRMADQLEAAPDVVLMTPAQALGDTADVIGDVGTTVAAESGDPRLDEDRTLTPEELADAYPEDHLRDAAEVDAALDDPPPVSDHTAEAALARTAEHVTRHLGGTT